jgi:hypothetical protein
MKSVSVRSERKPRHGWFDYEVLDVFGDDLGPYGITVYMVLARLCYGGFRVTMGVRELAGHARMSKSELARTLKSMIALGLVVEHKGRSGKSTSSYDLTDVKDLVEEVRALARARATVPVRDRSFEDASMGPQDGAAGLRLTNRRTSSGDAAQGVQDDLDGIEDLEAPDAGLYSLSDCPTQGQTQEAAEKPASVPPSGTDLSQSARVLGTDLSQSASRINRQEARNKKTRTTPAPVAWATSVLAAMAPLGVSDAQAPKRMLRDCRQANPDVALEEILFWIGWLADKAGQPGSSIREPGAYVIRMVGECVAGGQYAQLKAGAERRRAADEARERERQNAMAAEVAWESYQPTAPALADTMWRGLREALEKKVIHQSFETWIKPTHGLDFIDGKLYVRVPSFEFHLIGDKYGDLIQEAIDEQSLKVEDVLFVASPEELP